MEEFLTCPSSCFDSNCIVVLVLLWFFEFFYASFVD